MSSIWATLGVPDGSDRDAIRRGYARKLKTMNPEDDADGFKALREAYDEALQEAEWALLYGNDDDDEHEEEEEDHEAFAIDGSGPYTRSWPVRADTPGGAAPGDDAPLSSRGDDAFIAQAGRESVAFDALMGEFAKRLHPAAAADPDGLLATFDAIVASPVMDGISARSGAEAWLAGTIADSIPRSDSIIPHAIRTFGWDANDHRRLDDWHISRIVRRTDEWNYIATAEIPGTDAHVGWTTLTGPPLPPWRMRLLGWSATRRAQVARVLTHAEYEMPGLHFHMTPERVAWWQAFEARAYHTLSTLLLAPLVLWLVALAAIASFDDDASVGYATMVALPLALAAPTLWVRLVKRRQTRWLFGETEPPPRWFMIGWMPAAAAWPLVAMLLPGNRAGVAIAIVVSALLVLWTAIAQPPAPPTGTLAERIWSLAPRLAVPFFLFGAQSHLDTRRLIMWSAVAIAIGAVWLRGRERMKHVLPDILAELRVPLSYWAIPALIGFALLVHALMPATPLHYTAGLAVLVGFPLLLLLWSAEPHVKPFAAIAMWIALGLFYYRVVPPFPEKPKTAVTCPAGQAPDREGRCMPAAPAPFGTQPPVASPVAPLAPGAQPLPEADRIAAARERLVPPPPPSAPKPQRARCGRDKRTKPGPPEPCGNESQWTVESDYPEDARRNGSQGTARVDLAIDGKGKITACKLKKSSGTKSLDQATCTLMRSRGRYLPARDEDGPVPSVVQMSFTWKLTR